MPLCMLRMSIDQITRKEVIERIKKKVYKQQLNR